MVREHRFSFVTRPSTKLSSIKIKHCNKLISSGPNPCSFFLDSDKLPRVPGPCINDDNCKGIIKNNNGYFPLYHAHDVSVLGNHQNLRVEGLFALKLNRLGRGVVKLPGGA